MNKYSLASWIKRHLNGNSKPHEIVTAGIRRHFEHPEQSDIEFKGSPIELVNAMYIEWKRREAVYHCLFPTPLPVAVKFAKFAGVTKKDVVFDPGCGFGNLLYAAKQLGAKAFGCDFQEWLACDIAPILGLDVEKADFLERYKPRPFTCALMNPPFGRGYSDVLGDVSDLVQAFLYKIAELSSPKVRVAAILPRHYVEKTRPKALEDTLSRYSIVKRESLPNTTFQPLTNQATEMVLLRPAVGKRVFVKAPTIDIESDVVEAPEVIIERMEADLKEAQTHLRALARDLQPGRRIKPKAAGKTVRRWVLEQTDLFHAQK